MSWVADGCEKRLNEYVATYRYRDIETDNELGDGTNLVFIDLARFTKSIDECHSLEDMWLYSIKNMSRQNTCPDTITGTEIEPLFHMAELAKMTKEQRISLEVSIMSRNDMLNSMRETLEEACKEATAKGQVEGRAEGRAEVIQAMLQSGISPELISKALNMTTEQILEYLK